MFDPDVQLDQFDLNEFLIHDHTATFLLRVAGHSMTGAGIYDGDHVILDRSFTPKHGDVVVAVVDNELTLKRLHLSPDGVSLRADNPNYPNIDVKELSELQITGVITFGLHHLHTR